MKGAPDQSRRRWWAAADPVVGVVLGVAAVSTRLGTLPSDGLWFDDSWVAAGAIHGRLTELLTVGSAHPALTGLLMVLHDVGSGSLWQLGLPSLVAGVLGPPLLYLALRQIGTARSVALVLGSALAVAPVHILYSGRVKGYTIDTLLTLLLVAAVVHLADRTWRWPMAVLWGTGAVLVGSFSAYAIVASACATIVVALHPAGDRKVRLATLVGQGAVQLLYLMSAQQRTDLAGIEVVMETRFDGHLTFSWNPVDLVHEWLTHLGRVAEVYPGGPGGWLTTLGVLGVAGLVVGAALPRRRSEALACRTLLLMVVVATVGGFLERFPFGPTNHDVSAGGRHTLWLVPALAVGLAVLADRVRDLVTGSDRGRIGFDVLAIAAAIAVFVGGYEEAAPAPFPGSESATRFIDRSLGPDDALIITSTGLFAFADSTTQAVDLVPTPDHQVGFAPTFPDPRIHEVGVWAERPGTDDDIRRWVADAARVLVFSSGPFGRAGIDRVDQVLRDAGFTLEDHRFEWSVVQVWTRTS